MKKTRALSLGVLTAAVVTFVCARLLLAATIPLCATVNLSAASPATKHPYGGLMQATTQPVTVGGVTIGCTTQPTSANPEATLTCTYTCSASLQYRSLKSGSWGACPDSRATVNVLPPPASQPSNSPNFTITGVFPVGGYYQIAVTGNLTYTGDGNTYTDPGPTVVKYEYVTAVSVGIVWNGDPTDLLSATGAGIGSGTDITGQTVKTVVGAQVPLATAILPSDLIVSDTNWTIPGFSMPQGYAFSTISENPNSWWNSVTIMPAGCTFFAELRLMDLYSSPITFYWSQPAAAGNQMVSVSVVVQSGTGAGARSLTFDPSVTFVLEEPTPHVSPTFDQMYVDANYNDVADGRVYTGTWLHFGMDDGGPWGVEMHEKFDDAPDFASNAANWVQVFRQSQWGYHIVTGRFHPNKWVHAVPTVTVAPLLDSYYPLPT